MTKTILLLAISNVFMTFAWYGHLKNLSTKPLYIAIAVSWLIALVEYIFQVPANRIGINHFSLPQLKVIQEILTMIIFAGFAVWYMKVPLTRNFLYASICLIMAAYFIFQDNIK